jgi:hypothetical protein
MVSCLFFTHPSKKQFHMYGIFVKKVTVVPASSGNRECRRLSNGKNIKFSQKLGKSTSKTFQMFKQAFGEEALVLSAVFKWHKSFAHGERAWKMNVLVSQECSELNSRSKKLQCWCMSTTLKW